MRRLVLVAAALAASVAAADEPAAWTRPFLWRIDGARPSYLVGTMHLPDPRTAHLPPALTAALTSTDAVMLELRLDLATQILAGLRMVAPRGGGVGDVVPPSLQAQMKKVVEAHHGNWGLLLRMRPTAAMVTLGAMTAGPMHGEALDEALWDWARDHGKAHDGIETVDEQMAVFDGLSVPDQIALLEDEVKRLQAGESMEPLREAYFSGDEKRALALMRADRSPASRRFEHLLIDARNVRMAERIAARLKSGPPTVYAVGLMHVLGPGGLVKRLRKAGFKVTRVE